MKKLNKYLILLATAVFTLTACEKDIQREPSPAVDGTKVVAFKDSKVAVEVNPMKAKKEYALTIVRSDKSAALKANLKAVGDADIIKVPETVSLDAGVAETTVLLTFPDAQLDSTYSVEIEIAPDNQSPYLDGAAKCFFQVTIATWELSTVKAIVSDGLIGALYGVDPLAWYVKYQRKDNSDGSFDIRLLNPYASFDGGNADQFGFYSGYAYNAEEEVLEGAYNWDLHIAADNSVTFADFKLGMLWDASYGEFKAGLNEGKAGVYDPASKTITFAGGDAWCSMANLKSVYTWDDQPIVIILDAESYQNDHLTIPDYNAADIEWEEVKSEVNQFESTIFSFTNEEQKLFKAINPLPDNPKSPYINLYCLKNAYAEGGNLAFYWNGKDGDLEIPEGQNTKISFMGKELYIAEGAGIVETQKVKGVDVQVFSFELHVVSDADDEVGVFVETFSLAVNPIIYEKSDFLGTFTFSGYDVFSGSPYPLPVEIKEVDEFMAIVGLDSDTIWGQFDAETGALFIKPQLLVDSFAYNGKNYERAFVTIDSKFNEDFEEPLKFTFKLNGTAVIAPDCKMIGYLIYIPELEGPLDGMFDISILPTAAPSPAPRKAPATIRNQKTNLTRHNGPTTEHLSFKGKYDPRKLRENIR